MASIIQLRRDTAANWTAANPTLAQGEFGVETNTLKVKCGDGITAWNALAYIIVPGTPTLAAVLASGNDAAALEILNLAAPTTAASAATRAYADALVAWTRLDGLDNATDAVTLGALATYRTWIVEYVVDLQVSHRTRTGELRISHAGAGPVLEDDDYSFDGVEIAGLTWAVATAGANAELRLTKLAVGENTTLRYRIHAVPITP